MASATYIPRPNRGKYLSLLEQQLADFQYMLSASKPATSVAKEPRRGTKVARAKELFAQMQGQDKSVLIQAFMIHLDMTKAGATSYYYLLRDGSTKVDDMASTQEILKGCVIAQQSSVKREVLRELQPIELHLLKRTNTWR